MGWFYDLIDRKTLIAELTADSFRDLLDGSKISISTLASSYKGCPFSGVLYVVRESTAEKAGVAERKRWIEVHLLKFYRDRGQVSWGHKPMEESVHPYYYSCPLKYLSMVPEVTDAAWRAGVVDYWKRLRERRREKAREKRRAAPLR